MPAKKVSTIRSLYEGIQDEILKLKVGRSEFASNRMKRDGVDDHHTSIEGTSIGLKDDEITYRNWCIAFEVNIREKRFARQ